MINEITITQLDSMSAVKAVGETLRKIDARLIDHGERVAYIACRLNEYGKLQLDMKTLFLLGIFHDIGAYKTEEIDRMTEFETKDVLSHSVYGYLFLKYLSPLGLSAEAILYHHTPWSVMCHMNSAYMEYAALLHLADRIDIAYTCSADNSEMQKLLNTTEELFCPVYLQLYNLMSADVDLYSILDQKEYRDRNTKLCAQFFTTSKEAFEYLKMVVFSIDFRSEHTVTHSINTISVAVNIAQHFGVEGVALEKIYLGALLHDVGKIVIPLNILEYPGRLSDDKMAIMRTHVDETEKLIKDVIPEEICQIAIRHHEKLDGSGYPRGLTAKDLTLSQRIVAVADIVSALNSRRSYKDPFPKEKTIQILRDMAVNQLDPVICEYICEQYDTIIAQTEAEREIVIEKYQAISNEYSKLQERFTERVGDK